MKAYITLAAGLLFSIMLPLSAATSISLNGDHMLEVTDSQGSQVASLYSGSISQKITADSQTFKISYGQDLGGHYTLIIYPDPQSPQALDLMVLGQPIQMSQDSVLTILASDNGASARFQSGVLGEISLAGNPMPPGSSRSVQNGQVLTDLTDTPPELMDDTGKMTTADASSAPKNNISQSPAGGMVRDFSKGLIVKEVTGTVMMATAGQDVMDLLRNSTSLPKLKQGDVIPTGASVRTDFGGKLVVAQSPGVHFQLLENTNFKLDENVYEMKNGVEERKFKATVNKGGIISDLEGLDPNHTSYKIQTPLCVAAARGTAYSVYTSNRITVVITDKGTVEVITPAGTYTTPAGDKTVVNFNPSSNKFTAANFKATEEELQAIKDLIQKAKDLKTAINNEGPTGGPQKKLDDAVDDFLKTFQPTLNPGAVTPVTSGT